MDGAPGGIRTPDLRIRSPSLYPTELRAPFYTLPRLTDGGKKITFYRVFVFMYFSKSEQRFGCLSNTKNRLASNGDTVFTHNYGNPCNCTVTGNARQVRNTHIRAFTPVKCWQKNRNLSHRRGLPR
jgi:hypothetical protein